MEAIAGTGPGGLGMLPCLEGGAVLRVVLPVELLAGWGSLAAPPSAALLPSPCR